MKKTILTLAALTLIVISCKKTPIQQTNTNTTPPVVTVKDTSLVDKVVLQNGKAATRNDYKNGVIQFPINQQTTISISKAGTKGDSINVESRKVYLIDSTTTTYIWKGKPSMVLGLDSVIYNKVTKKVRYSNDCNGCGSGGSNIKVIITTN